MNIIPEQEKEILDKVLYFTEKNEPITVRIIDAFPFCQLVLKKLDGTSMTSDANALAREVSSFIGRKMLDSQKIDIILRLKKLAIEI
jgi:hypothetical protein